MEDDRLSEDDSLVSSDEDMAEEAGDAERREDLIACRDCGVVFAHIRRLEAHSQQGCGKKNGIALPMTGKDVEVALSGFPENTLSQRDRIRFIRIEDATGDKLYKIQKFPLKVSLAIAAFFKNNNDAFGRYHLLNNNCEHFVYTCTIGWKISLQAMAVYGVQIGRKVYLPRLSSPDDLDDKETIRTNTYKEMQPAVPPTETKLEPYFESNIKDIHKTLYESNVLSQFNQGKDMNVPVCRAERYPLLNLLTGKPTPPDIMALYGHRVVEYTEGDTFCKVKLKTGDVCLEL
ncbi:unnamed protein product [Mytilus edulis]|uniref:LRAT domain-containing protein n=1 Tax=Mytilus edulis TaxID=6550 RepID=A0A8S3TAG7_MYTED|nr:unnamed protein product [Mytilus edulis]